jgi:hypothetical protein
MENNILITIKQIVDEKRVLEKIIQEKDDQLREKDDQLREKDVQLEEKYKQYKNYMITPSMCERFMNDPSHNQPGTKYLKVIYQNYSMQRDHILGMFNKYPSFNKFLDE